MIDETLEHELQEHYEFDCYNELLDFLLESDNPVTPLQSLIVTDSLNQKDLNPSPNWMYEDHHSELLEDKENRLINLEFDGLVFKSE